MKIQLNDKELELLNQIIEQKGQNMAVSDLENVYLNENYLSIDEEGVQQLMQLDGTDEKESFRALFLDGLSLDIHDPEVEDMRMNCNFSNFEELPPNAYENDPYHLLTKHVKGREGNYSFIQNHFEPFEGFNYDETYGDRSNHFAEKSFLGYFRKRFDYLALLDRNVVWMSITPHEINTMRESICNAHGRVVTFGLGLGYFAYMVSLKEEVKEVVVVEKDNKVISLFNKYLLPLFPHKEKIKIVKEDAFHFFERKMNDTPFDYAFIDIYHTASDALPLYLRFKRAEKNIHTNTEFSYWIEESILCLLRRYVLTLIEEYYQGLKESDYDVIEDEESLILHVLYQALKEEEFNNMDSLLYLLSDQGLRTLAGKTKDR